MSNDEILKKTKTIFLEEINYWVDYWGLLEWDLSFSFEIIEESEDGDQIRGSCWADIENRNCLISLNTPEKEEIIIRKIAFHEICELFLYTVRDFAKSSCTVDEKRLDSEIHSIIRRLENTIFVEHIQLRKIVEKNK